MQKEKFSRQFKRYSHLLLVSFIVTLIFGVTEVSSMGSNKEKIISISFSSIDKGSRSVKKDREFVIIKTEKEWGDLWQLHKKTSLPEQQIHPVDFKEEMVIAVFSGEKRTGGYGIEITRIEENLEKGQLEVFFLETHPFPNSIVIQALTQPYHIVKLKKVDIPVVFFAGNQSERTQKG
jgi:hypothetical protein